MLAGGIGQQRIDEVKRRVLPNEVTCDKGTSDEKVTEGGGKRRGAYIAEQPFQATD